MIQKDLIKITQITLEKWGGAVGGVCGGNCGQSRMGLAEKLSAPEPMEMKRGLALWLRELIGSWAGSFSSSQVLRLRLRLWLGSRWALRLRPRLFFLEDALDDRAAAACISQQMVFCVGRKSGHSLAWQRVASLFFGYSRGNRLWGRSLLFFQIV